jgi:LysM repeat protein
MATPGGEAMRLRLALLLVTTLVLAACGGDASPTPGPTTEPTSEPTDLFVESPEPSGAVEPTPTEEPVNPTAEPTASKQTYRVKKGDTMWEIAREFGISVAALRKANPKVDPNTMRVGTVLVIPSE